MSGTFYGYTMLRDPDSGAIKVNHWGSNYGIALIPWSSSVNMDSIPSSFHTSSSSYSTSVSLQNNTARIWARMPSKAGYSYYGIAIGYINNYNSSISTRTFYDSSFIGYIVNNTISTNYHYSGSNEWLGDIPGGWDAIAVMQTNKYNISYSNLQGATCSGPTSATYDKAVYIPNPSTRTGYTFAGWTFNGSTSYAKYGTSSSSVTTSWTSTSTKVTSTYFKNLTTKNNGTVTLTANWTPNGYCLSFSSSTGSGNGTIPEIESSGWYTIGRNCMYSNNFTINIWAYMSNWTNIATDSQQIISCTNNGGFGMGYHANTKGHGFELYATGKGYYGVDMGLQNLSSGWHMLTGTFDGRYVRGYVDGVLKDTTDIGSAGNTVLYNPTNAIFVGAEAHDSATSPEGMIFTGKTKKLQIWNSAYNSTTVGAIYGSTSIRVKWVTYGSTYSTLPTPTRTGYTFKGWYKESSLTTQVTASTIVSTVSNHTLYAGWTPNNYTLTVNPSGGTQYQNLITNNGSNWSATGNNASIAYTASTGTYAFTNSSTSDPYVIVNYTVPLTAGVTYVMHAKVLNTSGSVVTSGSIQIFYGISRAFSEANSRRLSGDAMVEFTVPSSGTYNFRIDNDYGYNINIKQFWIARKDSATTSNIQYTVPYDSYQQLAVDTTRTGYTLTGYQSSNSGTTVTSDGVVKMGMATTVTVNWTANKYTVTLNPNGGSGGTASVTATYDHAMPNLTSLPTREGWKFLGYYDAQTGGTQYYTSTGASARAWNKASNTTLFAQWQEKTWIEDSSYYSTSLSGQGTETNPYKITSAKDLAYLAKQSQTNNFSGKYFRQTSNIDLSAHLWTSISDVNDYINSFAGIYDGGLYSVRNLRMNGVASGHYGLFYYTKNAMIKNINLQDIEIQGEKSASIGGIVSVPETTTIQNCVVTTAKIIGRNQIGGIVGVAFDSTISQCMVKDCTITGQQYIGGILGDSFTTSITDCNVINTAITCETGGIVCDTTSVQGDIAMSSSYGSGTINGTATKVMYGDATAWGNWSLVEGVNGGLPVQKGLYHIGGFTDSKKVYDHLVAWKNS